MLHKDNNIDYVSACESVYWADLPYGWLVMVQIGHFPECDSEIGPRGDRVQAAGHAVSLISRGVICLVSLHREREGGEGQDWEGNGPDWKTGSFWFLVTIIPELMSKSSLLV